jgi:predicted transcriptional regulator
MSDVTVTVRMSSTERDRLEFIANYSKRSKSFLAKEAIVQYLDSEEAVIAGINTAMAEMRSGKGIPHDEAMLQIRSTITQASKS